MLNEAIAKVHQDLKEVHGIKKCSNCECLLDVLEWLKQDLENIKDTDTEFIKREFNEWFDAGNKQRHQCLGCEVCLPTEPYNQFSAVLSQATGQTKTTTESPACSCGGT